MTENVGETRVFMSGDAEGAAHDLMGLQRSAGRTQIRNGFRLIENVGEKSFPI
jgi:hypothetical protein